MSTIINQIKSNDPAQNITTKEFEHTFLSYCTCVCLVCNKKMNLAKIFIILLQNPSLRNAFMQSASIDNEWTLLKKFLEYDPSLHKSKYIKNYISSCKKPLKN